MLHRIAATSRARRSDLAVAGVLLAITAAAWAATAVRMAGMDAGLWTYPDTLGLFGTTWISMMAAMMLPSTVPTVVAYARAAPGDQARRATLAMTGTFVAGYLAVWSAAGLIAFALLRLGSTLDSGLFTGNAAGRYLAAGVLLVAAAYELTPLKRACLRCCTMFPGSLPGRREGGAGALGRGLASGAWCVGCCWALMVTLLALGAMSLTWMIVISVIVTAEKLLPSRRLPSFAVAAVLAALAIGLLVGAPIPAVPGHGGMSM